jgi:hypothetical protein
MTWTFDADEDIPFPSGTASGDGALLHLPAEHVCHSRVGKDLDSAVMTTWAESMISYGLIALLY